MQIFEPKPNPNETTGLLLDTDVGGAKRRNAVGLHEASWPVEQLGVAEEYLHYIMALERPSLRNTLGEDAHVQQCCKRSHIELDNAGGARSSCLLGRTIPPT